MLIVVLIHLLQAVPAALIQVPAAPTFFGTVFGLEAFSTCNEAHNGQSDQCLISSEGELQVVCRGFSYVARQCRSWTPPWPRTGRQSSALPTWAPASTPIFDWQTSIVVSPIIVRELASEQQCYGELEDINQGLPPSPQRTFSDHLPLNRWGSARHIGARRPGGLSWELDHPQRNLPLDYGRLVFGVKIREFGCSGGSVAEENSIGLSLGAPFVCGCLWGSGGL